MPNSARKRQFRAVAPSHALLSGPSRLLEDDTSIPRRFGERRRRMGPASLAPACPVVDPVMQWPACPLQRPGLKGAGRLYGIGATYLWQLVEPEAWPKGMALRKAEAFA